jgi:exopolysaccharide production protein ExoQ
MMRETAYSPLYPAPWQPVAQRAQTSLIEDALVLMLLIFPIFGTFLPLESYLAPQDFSMQGADQELTAIPAFLPSGKLVISLCVLTFAAYFLVPGVIQRFLRFRYLLLMAFPLIAIASSAWSADPGYTFNRSARLLVYLGFGLLLPLRYDLPRLMGILVMAFILSGLCSLAIVLVRPDLGLSLLVGYEGAWRGALIHKNSLGALASIGVVTAAYVWWTSIRYRLPAIFAFLLSLLLLLMARSATSYLATIAAGGIAAFGMLLQRVNWTFRLVLIAFALLAAVLMSFVVVMPDFVSTVIGRDISLTGRTDVWLATMDAIWQRPVMGYGLGFWGIQAEPLIEVWDKLQWAAPSAHNSWLDTWLQLGLPGLVIVIIAWLIALSSGLKTLFFTEAPGAVFSLCLLFQIFVRSMSETLFVEPGSGSMFWFALAFGCLEKIRSSHAWPVRPAVRQPAAHVKMAFGRNLE